MKKLLLILLIVSSVFADFYVLDEQSYRVTGFNNLIILTTCENNRVFSTTVHLGTGVTKVQVYNRSYPMTCEEWKRNKQ